MTGIYNGSSCVDFKAHCGDEYMRDLRLLCSVTCGCANPLSGLLWDGPTQGCPRDVCRISPPYQEALATLQCRDLTLAELHAMPAWTWYFNQYVRWVSVWLGPDAAKAAVGTRSAFMAYGCNALTMTSSLGVLGLRSFCVDSSGMSSIRTFCSVSCGCIASQSSNCPSACTVQQNATP